MIPRALKHVFPNQVRDRGEAYFAQGHVRLVRSDTVHLVALVRGSEQYSVHISAGRGHFSMSCSCPYADENWTCKHIWATILAAEGARKLATLINTVGKFDETVFGPDDDAAESGDELDDDFTDDDVDLYDDEDVDDFPPIDLTNERRIREAPPTFTPVPAWKLTLERARQASAYEPARVPRGEWPANRRLVYIVDLPSSTTMAGLVVELATEKLLRDGTFEPPKKFQLGADVWLQSPDDRDRVIAQMLIGARPQPSWGGQTWHTQGFLLAPPAFATTLRAMCDTGRCRLRRERGERPTETIEWDAGPPWTLALRVSPAVEQPGYELAGVLRRANEEMPLQEPTIVHSCGVLAARGRLALFQFDAPFQFVAELRKAPIFVETHELPALLGSLFALPRIPTVELPADTRVEQCAPVPVPCLTVAGSPHHGPYVRHRYYLSLAHDYGGGLRVDAAHDRPTVFHAETMRLVQRDIAAETAARQHVINLGARPEQDWMHGRVVLALATQKFEPTIRALLAKGWRVDVEGVVFRALDTVRTTVSSGIDWFDVRSVAAFGDREVPVSALLDAIRRGQDSVALGDGSRGVVTADWARRLAPLLAAGATTGETTRFQRSQTGVLDALLASLPDANVDATFETARAELRAFDSVSPADAPGSFTGTLRPYQRDGLGWLHFLRRFGLGGCLADDMGLGKTIQVLALLEARRAERAGPSLIVVPKSLVFNWMQEASRFTPALRVRDHTGAQRRDAPIDTDDVDVVITTYGTLRRDVVHLREIEFDYVVLDEAQAIKNATTASAKAARLLRARHRLALSGTPIENRIDELWSLMEFLNPGMLGTSSAFGALVRRRASSNGDAPPEGVDQSREFLARALKPVILRRTKGQVAKDLPNRIEQTLMVELEPAQRAIYDRLLDQYRAELLPHVDRVGIARAKLKVLEALLRLRQAACHPALLGTKHAESASAKLDVLIPKLVEARAEGHKTLVFSQFTSFLAQLRTRLDGDAVTYAYLDGKTRNRQAEVERFQSDDACPLFLISLKAGGHGLNLTAAEYVFLLDPWWNPAVEAQAIDRAHRIGQTRHVIATRLVARDTIEEKILELQRSKRELADAILGEDAGLIAKIGADELRMLLG